MSDKKNEVRIEYNKEFTRLEGSVQELLSGLAQIVHKIKEGFLKNDVAPERIIEGMLKHAFELGLMSKEEIIEKEKQMKESARETRKILKMILDELGEEEETADENIG